MIVLEMGLSPLPCKAKDAFKKEENQTTMKPLFGFLSQASLSSYQCHILVH